LTLHHPAVHATLLSLAGIIGQFIIMPPSEGHPALWRIFRRPGWNASVQKPARDLGPDLGQEFPPNKQAENARTARWLSRSRSAWNRRDALSRRSVQTPPRRHRGPRAETAD